MLFRSISPVHEKVYKIEAAKLGCERPELDARTGQLKNHQTVTGLIEKDGWIYWKGTEEAGEVYRSILSGKADLSEKKFEADDAKHHMLAKYLTATGRIVEVTDSGFSWRAPAVEKIVYKVLLGQETEEMPAVPTASAGLKSPAGNGKVRKEFNKQNYDKEVNPWMQELLRPYMKCISSDGKNPVYEFENEEELKKTDEKLNELKSKYEKSADINYRIWQLEEMMEARKRAGARPDSVQSISDTLSAIRKIYEHGNVDSAEMRIGDTYKKFDACFAETSNPPPIPAPEPMEWDKARPVREGSDLRGTTQITYRFDNRWLASIFTKCVGDVAKQNGSEVYVDQNLKGMADNLYASTEVTVDGLRFKEIRRLTENDVFLKLAIESHFVRMKGGMFTGAAGETWRINAPVYLLKEIGCIDIFGPMGCELHGSDIHDKVDRAKAGVAGFLGDVKQKITDPNQGKGHDPERRKKDDKDNEDEVEYIDMSLNPL